MTIKLEIRNHCMNQVIDGPQFVTTTVLEILARVPSDHRIKARSSVSLAV